MAEENKKQEIEKKQEVVKAEKEIAKDVTKIENKVEEGKITQKQAEKEIKKEVKEETDGSKIKSKKKEIKDERFKKTDAVVNARNLSVSTKHSVAICNYIRGKSIDKSILMLEEVEKFKKPLPMKGEIPHRKGKIMSGRYPVKAVQEFIKLLKSLNANAVVNELELENYVISCKANIAPRPYKRFGRARFKRTHVTLKLVLPVKKVRKEVKR